MVTSPADLDVYVAAFGATELNRMVTPDGSLMHAELRFGDSVVFFSQVDPQHDARMKVPSELGAVPFSLMLYVDDADATYAQAIEAGATGQGPVQEMFWGDRWGMVADDVGHTWGISTHVINLTPEEIQQRMMEQFGGGAPTNAAPE